MEIVAKPIGFQETAALIDGMPPLFRDTIRHWMFSDRKRYGAIFKRTIARQKHNAGAPSMFRMGGNWQGRVAAPFKSVSISENANEMSMAIGLQARGGQDITQGFKKRLMMMEQSTGENTEMSSDKFMPIPVWRNLNKNSAAMADIGALPLNRRGGATILKRLIRSKSVTAIKKNGTMYYYDNDMEKRGGGFKRSALLFVGKKLVRLRKRYDFVKQWEGRKDAVVDNFVTKINRMLRNISRGYLQPG